MNLKQLTYKSALVAINRNSHLELKKALVVVKLQALHLHQYSVTSAAINLLHTPLYTISLINHI